MIRIAQPVSLCDSTFLLCLISPEKDTMPLQQFHKLLPGPLGLAGVSIGASER